MKHFYTRALLLLVAVFAFDNIANADYTTISFLKSKVYENQECTEDNFKEYYECNHPDFITGMSFQNVKLKTSTTSTLSCGIWLEAKPKPETQSIVDILFNPNSAMNITQIDILGYKKDVPTGAKLKLQWNDTEREVSISGSSNPPASYDFSYLQKVIMNETNEINKLSTAFITQNYIEPVKNLKIILSPYNGESCGIQVVGIRFKYSSTTDLSEVETAVEDLEAEQGIRVYEYYDLMGRRLAEAPQRGVYVRKCGGKVEKLIANGI